MRDVILIGFIGACLAAALRYPFAGLLTWAWFTLMTPHQLAYGVFGIPLNTIIAAITLLAYAASGEITRFRPNLITILIIALAGWLSVSQLFSLAPDVSAPYFDRFIKTLLFILLCAQMTSDRLRFHALVWLLVPGVGFFAVKGALFTLVTLGQYRVQGLENTVLEDNNHFGIAAATILPMILYLRSHASAPWLRVVLLSIFVLTIVAVIGTHSRGAFLALITFAAFYWARAQRKFMILAGLALVLAPAVAFMPAKWTERMTTITAAAQDESFQGRVDAWVINYKFARDNPITGAGLRVPYDPELALQVDPERAARAKAAHSIYFEILGGTGFVGLTIYLALLAAAFLAAWNWQHANLNSRVDASTRDFSRYALISLTVFAVGGASTSMEMWDGYLIVIALVAAASKRVASPHAPTGSALVGLRRMNWRRRSRLSQPVRGSR
ncbi:MAG: putative O-glycosylation ligase, exosortase A system-associated [Hyphococcus sp.]